MMFIILASILFGYVYEDSDSLIVNNDSITICGNHQYNIKVCITNSKVNIQPWIWNLPTDSIGWLCLNAPLILIKNSSSIIGSQAGYEGGVESTPAGFGPGFGDFGLSGGGGGAGYGGKGGKGGDIWPGFGGITYGDSSDTLINMGSGGGAGFLSVVDGAGGDGGAMICLRAQKIIIDSSNIQTNGQTGYDGALEAGGGGSGGGTMIWADSSVIHYSLISANGASGGSAAWGAGGGAGGGRIKIFYSCLLDTHELVLSAQGGIAGAGSYGDPEDGENGSIYIGQILGIIESVAEKPLRFMIQSTLIRGRIRITIKDPPILLRLYDISGRIAETFWLDNKVEFIYLDNLQQGIYFLQSEDNKTVSKIVLLK